MRHSVWCLFHSSAFARRLSDLLFPFPPQRVRYRTSTAHPDYFLSSPATAFVSSHVLYGLSKDLATLQEEWSDVYCEQRETQLVRSGR